MTSCRNLEKTTRTDVEEMLFDLSILHAIASEERKPAIGELTNRVIDSENDFVARISHTDGRGEARLVRKYYSKLQEEYLYFANEIEGEVNRLSDGLLTPEVQLTDEANMSHIALVWLAAHWARHLSTTGRHLCSAPYEQHGLHVGQTILLSGGAESVLLDET